MKRDIPPCFNILTCIVDEDVQSGFSLQEGFSKAANRLETCQIQLHEHHLSVPALLEHNNTNYESQIYQN